MNIYKNKEGYSDPTAGAVILKMLREEKRKARLLEKKPAPKPPDEKSDKKEEPADSEPV